MTKYGFTNIWHRIGCRFKRIGKSFRRFVLKKFKGVPIEHYELSQILTRPQPLDIITISASFVDDHLKDYVKDKDEYEELIKEQLIRTMIPKLMDIMKVDSSECCLRDSRKCTSYNGYLEIIAGEKSNVFS